MKKKKAIVFDWDGTLFHSMEYKRENIVRVFEDTYGAPRKLVDELHRELSGLPRRDIFEAILQKLHGAKRGSSPVKNPKVPSPVKNPQESSSGQNPKESQQLDDQEFAKLSHLYTSLNIQSSVGAHLFDDAQSILHQLKAQKIPVFVSSSAAQAEIDFAIGHTHANNFFQLAYGSEGNFHKGDPHFDKFIGFGMGAYTKADLLFVGDDEKDRMIARASGVDFFQICRESISIKRNDVIHDLSALCDFF